MKNTLLRARNILYAWMEQRRNLLLFLYTLPMVIALVYTLWSWAVLFAPFPIDPIPGVIYYIHETQPKLIAYMLLVPALFLLYMLFALCISPANRFGKWWYSVPLSGADMLCQLFYGILLGILTFQFKHIPEAALCLCLCFFLPIYRLPWTVWWRYVKKYFVPVASALAFGLLFVLFFAAFLPFVSGPVYIGTEYRSVSSLYKPLRNTPDQILSKTIPSWSLIRSNPYCVHSPKLRIYMSQNQNLRNLYISSQKLTYYLYEKQPDEYCLMRPLSAHWLTVLQFRLPHQEWVQLQTYSQILTQWHSAALDNLSQSPHIRFLKRSQYQFEWQTLGRGFIHHHNHLFGMAHQFALGRPVREIFMQYGWLQTVGLGYILKKFNRLDYASYIHVYYSFYFLYFFCFLGGIWFLLRDKKYVLLGGFLALSGWLSQTYLYLYLGPGTNPVRYFMYVFVLCFLVNYIQTQRISRLCWAVVAAWVSICINMQFGFFAVIALSGALVIYIWEQLSHNFMPAVCGLACLWAGAVALFLLLNITPNPVNAYFFSGLLAFNFGFGTLVYFGLWTVLCYGLLFANWKKNRPVNYALLFLTFFTQGIYLYYIRSAGYYHFCAISSIFVLQAVLALKICEGYLARRWQKYVLSVILFALAGVMLVRGGNSFWRSKRYIRKYFSSYELYHWQLPGTRFYSTMNPEDFLSSIALIKKYSPDQKGIYIISQFDNFLPFLSEHYSAMPFIDLQWYLITQKEFDAAKDSILKNKPQYLFVETSLQEPQQRDIIPADYPVIGYLHQESLWRAERMSLLKRLFESVSDDYILVEQTLLLQVYKRRN